MDEHGAGMIEWLSGQGVRLDRLKLARQGDAGRGLFARGDIEEGEIVLSVPSACLITTERARQTPVGWSLQVASLHPVSPHDLMAAFILRERSDPSSFFQPFLQTFPPVSAQVPLFQRDSEVHLLQASYVTAKIAARKEMLRRTYTRFQRLPELKGITFEDYVWARFVVFSRVFGVKIDGEDTQALVPMGDMMNHRRAADVLWRYSDERRAFELVASRRVAEGEPIHANYGRKCNGSLLLNYGFVLDDNDDNEAVVSLSMPRSVSSYVTKSRLLGKTVGNFPVSARLSDKATRAALSFLRVAYASPDEISHALSEDSGHLSAVREAEVMRVLAAACRKALARFATTEEQDSAVLEGEALSPMARNCVIMRRGEKRVLRSLAAAADEAAEQQGMRDAATL